MIKIDITDNEKRKTQIREAIRKNDGYCCCAIEKTPDTKCICKDFITRVEGGYIGPCHCGLYISKTE